MIRCLPSTQSAYQWICSIAIISMLHSGLVLGDQRPNIVLLMGDDHGWDETGYNGHPHLKTPILDEMAANGLRLDRFYSAHPSCSPTRGSVITGRHPNRYGTFAPGHSIRPEEISIAQILRDAGYACGHFGKWHLGPVKAESPTNPGAMGFEQWLSHDNFFELNPWFSRNGGPPQQFMGESSQIVVEHTIEFINSAHKLGKPFFTVVWFGSPHEPYSALPDDLALYENLPASYAKKQFRLTSNETGLPVNRPLNEVLQERYAEITAMDRAIGQLRHWLLDNDLSKNTLLWYCGDNGTPGDGIITSPFRGQKGNTYEGGIRVPGLMEWPERIPAPRASDVNTVTSDMLPTLCELVGVPQPVDRPLDGISLKPLIDGVMSQRSKPICFWAFASGREADRQPYIAPDLQQGTTPLAKKQGNLFTRNFLNFHFNNPGDRDYDGSRVILGNQYKLVVNGRDGETQLELFDVRSDPAEKINLLESNREIANELARELRQWQQSVLHSLTGADYK